MQLERKTASLLQNIWKKFFVEEIVLGFTYQKVHYVVVAVGGEGLLKLVVHLNLFHFSWKRVTFLEIM